jgi:threonine dehydrogenase-like Zn-dependent dehydrogenase
MTTARAVRFTAPRTVRVGPVNLPAPASGEIVVRTSYSGISAGTELLAYRGELDPSTVLDDTLTSLSGSFTYPFSYGYSCVGTVEQGTAAIAEGSAVFAFHPHQDRSVVAETDVIVLRDDADLRVATLFPLVETALQVSLDAGQVAGAQVVAGEPQPWRREVGNRLGLTAVPPEELPDRVATETGGRGTPLLVESSGVPQALADGLALLAHEGTALVGSWYGAKQVSLPLGEHFHRRRLTIRSSQVSTIPAALQARWDRPRRRAAALDLLDELPMETFATTEFAFEDAAQAYEAVDRGGPGLLHAALRYE